MYSLACKGRCIADIKPYDSLNVSKCINTSSLIISCTLDLMCIARYIAVSRALHASLLSLYKHQKCIVCILYFSICCTFLKLFPKFLPSVIFHNFLKIRNGFQNPSLCIFCILHLVMHFLSQSIIIDAHTSSAGGKMSILMFQT